MKSYYLKSEAFIRAWLKEKGYMHDETDNWFKEGFIPFDRNMFKHCGGKVPVNHIWDSAWIEEREE